MNINKLREDLNSLNEKDIAVLRILEGLRRNFEYVNLKRIYDRYNYKNKKELFEILRKLNKLSLISFGKLKNEEAFKLNEKAYSFLALWDLKKQGVIKDILRIIGQGKEAKIYLAKDYNEEYLVVKEHLYYGMEFERIKKSYSYLAIKWRLEQLNIEDYQIDFQRAKAQIESQVLQRLYNKYNVPNFVSINRHLIVMDYIKDENNETSKTIDKLKFENPKDLKEDIIEIYYKIYEKESLVHGDLSEKNILFSTYYNNFYIIDWPQAIPKDFELANKIFEKDLNNINNFFKRKYNI